MIDNISDLALRLESRSAKRALKHLKKSKCVTAF